MTDIETWTIYDHPSDFPDLFIARKFIDGKATHGHIEANDLQTIREFMQDNAFLCLGRMPHDDPVIVETWIY